jgi:4-amino-4-deoxy-L-arabinose transferase-like glycosyltransferase
MFVDIMEVDAAQYASMSLEMLQTGSFLQIFEEGADYLDKPPLLFWLSSFSLSIFGIHTWAYKLPSVLFCLLAIYSTYRFTLIYYGRKTALLAALMVSSAQAIYLMNNDVRTDNLLLGSVSLAFWQIAEIEKGSKRFYHLLGAGLGIGLGMLAKGPLGLVIPALAFGPVWLLQGRWQMIFNWRWLPVLATVLLLLTPMCIGLYLQFDAQPDKVIHGKTGVSGLYFYFWEQSFGRITGDSSWKNESGHFFFVHTYLWAFFPWVLLLIPALFDKIKTRTSPEWYSLCGFILTFVALSASRFKLPHYIYVTIPFAAVIAGNWISSRLRENQYPAITAYIIMILSTVFTAFLHYYVFPDKIVLHLLSLVLPALVLVALFTFIPTKTMRNLVIICSSVWYLNWQLSTWFYPRLMEYQSSSTAMKYLVKEGMDDMPVYYYGNSRAGMHFYLGRVSPRFDGRWPEGVDSIIVLSRRKDLQELQSYAFSMDTIKKIPEFSVSLLNGVFLSSKSRVQAIDTAFLIKINANNNE